MGVLISVFLYLLAIMAIWLGASLIIKAVDRISRKLRVSSFAMSFFVLGLMTSIPEMAVGVNAVINHKPEVFVGSLLGGVVVIFLLIIPLLAILGNGIKLNHDLDTKKILGLLTVIAAPGLMIVDKKVTTLEGLFLVILYVAVFFLIERKHGVLEGDKSQILFLKAYSILDLGKVVLGMGLVFVASQYVVSQTIFFAQLLHMPAFYISLILLSLGINLPEMSLALRAIMTKKKDIAFGDYLGSAAANTLLFGLFTLASGGEVLALDGFGATFMFVLFGLGLFYFFSRSKKEISRKEGFVLLVVYLAFVIFELGRGMVA